MSTSSTAAQLTDWLNTVLDAKSPRTREGYAHVVRRLFVYLEERSYPTELTQLRPMHLRGFFATCRKTGMSANSLANFDRTLRAIFARLDREGREDFDLPATWKNPLASVEKLRPQNVQKIPLSADQAKQLTSPHFCVPVVMGVER
jgi:site-specific recombinase XerC